MEYRDKVKLLQQQMREYAQHDLMIAFSGGVDSSLLVKVAVEAAKDFKTLVYAVTARTNLHSVREMENAAQVANELGAIHEVVTVDVLEEAGIQYNPENRCYLCKKCIFTRICQLAREKTIPIVLDGTNQSDLREYRPGIQALQELSIHSVLAECGITKEEVRKLAEEYGISVSHKPAMPCMATRFPYGTELDYKAMAVVERAEQFIRELGCYNVRVRVHDSIARLEVDLKNMDKVIEQRQIIVDFLKKLGYTYVTLDLEGFRTGSMDIHIKKGGM